MATVGQSKKELNWIAIAVVGGIHLLALAALIPWLFSWTGVVLAILGCYFFGTLGINLGYHRLLSHRSFKCPLWFEHGLAIIGVCCLEKTPGQFVATHRAHHHHTDVEGDPHSPLKTLFWGHMGWLFVNDPQMYNAAMYDRYARDIFRDRFYLNLERNFRWLWIYAFHVLLFGVIGFLVGLILPEATFLSSVQFGLSVMVWGALVRTVLVWHITWSVNSIGHVWGYRNYETRENSRNNIFVGLISNGDGWHNNHHADQRAASHGHKWWELDVTYITLVMLRTCGLAWDVVPVTGQASEPVDASMKLANPS